jgi:hypothetical protein
MGHCIHCKQDLETVYYLLIHCPYAMKVWKEMDELTEYRGGWQGLIANKCLKTQTMNKGLEAFQGLPLVVAPGI